MRRKFLRVSMILAIAGMVGSSFMFTSCSKDDDELQKTEQKTDDKTGDDQKGDQPGTGGSTTGTGGEGGEGTGTTGDEGGEGGEGTGTTGTEGGNTPGDGDIPGDSGNPADVIAVLAENADGSATIATGDKIENYSFVLSKADLEKYSDREIVITAVNEAGETKWFGGTIDEINNDFTPTTVYDKKGAELVNLKGCNIADGETKVEVVKIADILKNMTQDYVAFNVWNTAVKSIVINKATSSNVIKESEAGISNYSFVLTADDLNSYGPDAQILLTVKNNVGETKWYGGMAVAVSDPSNAYGTKTDSKKDLTGHNIENGVTEVSDRIKVSDLLAIITDEAPYIAFDIWSVSLIKVEVVE